jgi:hypothetical protein
MSQRTGLGFNLGGGRGRAYHQPAAQRLLAIAHDNVLYEWRTRGGGQDEWVIRWFRLSNKESIAILVNLSWVPGV